MIWANLQERNKRSFLVTGNSASIRFFCLYKFYINYTKIIQNLDSRFFRKWDNDIKGMIIVGAFAPDIN